MAPQVALKKKEIELFRGILLEERKKILHHLETLSNNSTDEEIGSGDSVDIAAQEISQASIQKIGKRETYLLKKIDLALKKIDEGTFGECEECGEPIGAARLKARPVAQLCIDCKTEQENEERRYSTKQEEAAEGEDIFAEESDEG